MTGHTKFSDVAASRGNPEREARVSEIKQAMDVAVALAALRQARGATQTNIAIALGTTQGNVSQMERRGDLYLSSIRDYVEALGGRLVVDAEFPDGERLPVMRPAEGAAG